MKAIQVQEYGGPEVLKLVDLKPSKPGSGEALVAVKAAGVNFVDIYLRKGTYRSPKGLPYIPGWEGCGVVEEVGAGVTHVKKGDRVSFLHDTGTYTQSNIFKADRLIPIPDSITFEQGAAFPLQGLTAHYLLHEYREVKSGEVVLIHAAAGGMGLLLTQWARHLGATVIGTVSTEEKAKAAQQAGAHHTILYSKQDFVQEVKKLTGGHGADLIIDGVGKTTFKGDLEACAKRGNIVIFGAASGPADPVVPNYLMVNSLTISGGSLTNYILTHEETMMRVKAVLSGIKEGWLKLKIDHQLPLEQAAEAHRLLENRQTIGKVILKT
jgi:NADPH:quinone reductase